MIRVGIKKEETIDEYPSDSHLTINDPLSSTIIISKDENDIFGDILPVSPKPVVHKIRKIYEKRKNKDEPKLKKARRALTDLKAQINEEAESEEDDHVFNKKSPKTHKSKIWPSKEVRDLKKNKKEDLLFQQCYGPECVKESQIGSKYCSPECGYKLAEHRLKYILQARVKDYYKITPVAENNDDKKILMLNLKKVAVERKLEIANSFANTLNIYLYQLANFKPDENDVEILQDNSDHKISMTCMLCNEDVWQDEYQFHVNACWAKLQHKYYIYSKNSSTKNTHDFICNKYIPRIRSYCRRLRYACTEHSKNEHNFKICGYPYKLASNSGSSKIEELFAMSLNDLIVDGVCQNKKCVLHSEWQVNLLSLLDNHQMNLLSCLDQISVEYQRVQQTYMTRGDALTLLINLRKLSKEESQKEEIDYRSIQMTTSITFKQK